MKSHFTLLDKVIRWTWRRRRLAALVIALYLMAFAPLVLEPDFPNLSVRYEFSSEHQGKIESLIFFDHSIQLPTVVKPVLVVLFILGGIFITIAQARMLKQWHWPWPWFPILFLFPFIIFYYLFGPDEPATKSS